MHEHNPVQVHVASQRKSQVSRAGDFIVPSKIPPLLPNSLREVIEPRPSRGAKEAIQLLKINSEKNILVHIKS
jgi:hypothetical protein